MEIRAARSIPATPERLFDFLGSLENHVVLIRDAADPAALDDGGAQIRLRGPLGLRRTVRTRLTYMRSPEAIGGTAEAGRLTHGRVRWSIQPSDGGSWVEVAVTAERLGPLDRLLLLLGGGRWLEKSLHTALEQLEEQAVAGLGVPVATD